MSTSLRSGIPPPRNSFLVCIAAIALVDCAPLATRNTPDFTDLSLRLINPWIL